MPKRKGHILEKIADMDNLRAADKEAQAGKVRKNRHIRRHNERAESDLLLLREMILGLRFPPAGYTTMTVKGMDGKVREIVKQKYFPWRVLHRAILRVIEDDLHSSLIMDTYSCIRGKGLHFGVRRMKSMLRRHPENKWFWKADYKKFYPSIPHETVLASLRRKYKDERFIKLISLTLFTYDSGSEMIKILEDEEAREKRIGNRWFDEPGARERLRERGGSPHERKGESEVLPPLLRRRGRACTDEGGSRKGASPFCATVEGCRPCREGQRRVVPHRQGDRTSTPEETDAWKRGRAINFLGYCFTHGDVRLRKSIKKSFARKAHRIKSRSRRMEIFASYHGWCKWGNCRTLWKKLSGKEMGFTRFGIKQSNKTKDGKKFFDVHEVRLMDILNVPVTIVDFEADVKTKLGDGRYCVLFERDGKRGKFITTSFNIKDVLDQARALEDAGREVFPVEGVVVKRKSLGDGKSVYYFED